MNLEGRLRDNGDNWRSLERNFSLIVISMARSTKTRENEKDAANQTSYTYDPNSEHQQNRAGDATRATADKPSASALFSKLTII